MNSKKYLAVLQVILFDLLLLIPFVLLCILVFLIVFFGISGILSGFFLIFSYLTAFRVNIMPAGFYKHGLLLFSYAFFFIGVGGLLLAGMSLSVSGILSALKKCYQWNLSVFGGNANEK